MCVCVVFVCVCVCVCVCLRGCVGGGGGGLCGLASTITVVCQLCNFHLHNLASQGCNKRKIGMNGRWEQGVLQGGLGEEVRWRVGGHWG